MNWKIHRTETSTSFYKATDVFPSKVRTQHGLNSTDQYPIYYTNCLMVSRNKKPSYSHLGHYHKFAARLGLEPRLRVPETRVLPLDDLAIIIPSTFSPLQHLIPLPILLPRKVALSKRTACSLADACKH